MRAKLSEYHTGYRAYRREILEAIPFEKFSDDFIFDNQFLIAAIVQNFRIGELSCPTKYFKEASSINFIRSVKYGFGVLGCAIAYFFHSFGIRKIFWMEKDENPLFS